MKRDRESACHTSDRVGHPDPDRVFWQGAAPWGPERYGNGGETVGRWGCPLVALAHALRVTGGRAGATPMTVLDRARAFSPPVWGPGTSLASLPSMARSAEFSCPDKPTWTEEGVAAALRAGRISPQTAREAEAVTVAGLRAWIVEHIRGGGFVWLHVDKTDDGIGDHWVLVHAFTDGRVIHYVDSATAKVGELAWDTLTGVSVWSGKRKTYTPVKAYPLHL